MTRHAQPTGRLNKRALAEAVAAELDTTPGRGRAAVDAVFNVIARAVASGYDVSVSNFGTFQPYPTPARKARNPLTGGPVAVPAGQALRFRISPRLRENVRIGAADATIRKHPKTPRPRE